MVYGGALVFDGHMDTPLRIVDEGLDLGERHPDGHADLPRMREGGLDAAFLAAWVDPAYGHRRALARAEELIAAIRGAAETHADQAGFATSAADVRQLAGLGRIALLAGVEGGHALEGRVENAARLYDLGARYLTLTWMNSNAFADAAGGEALHGGLSDLGRELVAEMNRLGLMIDLSHAAPSTFSEVLEATADPVVVSHSATEVLGPHFRNLSNDQLRGIADNGGLIGINFFARYLAPGSRTVPDWTVIVDHIERVVDIAGIDHAALGSDFDGVPQLPDGMTGVEDLPKIADALEGRGYKGDDLAKILGANWLRVLERVVDRTVTNRQPISPSAR